MIELEEIKKEDAEMEVDNTSSDSEDENEEVQLQAKAKELEEQIKNYPYSYDSYVELISVYKKQMNLSEMRTVYEKFKEVFPLTPTLWLNWIKDEMNIACSENEKKNVLNLFELAVKDYLSVELWLEYVQYSVGCNDPTEARKIFENAINEAGLHVSKGSLIWDAYREFELAHLSCVSEVETEIWETQAKRVSEVFRRQLSVTLFDMERTNIEWRVWCEKLPKSDFINRDQVEWAYKKAIKYIDDYKDFEDRLLTDEDKLTVFRDYIKYERKPEVVRCLYERGVAESSLKSDFWLEYCLYFFKLNNFTACAQTAERALRNCPWSEELWVFLMQALELTGESHDKITKTFERALSAEFQAPYQYSPLWLTYLSYYKRITNPDEKESVEKLRSAFQKGHEHLIKNFGDEADPEHNLLRFWAKVEASFLKNMQEARIIWNDYGLLKVHGSEANYWLELIELEKYYGDEKHLRKTYQRALTSTKDWPQCIGQSWVNYERECGNVESMINCVQTYTAEMKRYEKEKVRNQEIEEQKEEKIRKRKHDTEKKYYKTKQGKITKDEMNKEKITKIKTEIEDVVKKEKEELPKNNEEKTFEHVELNDEKQNRSLFVSNLEYSVTEEELTEFLGKVEEIRLVKDRKGISRGYAYAIFLTQEEAQKTLARDRERLNGRPVYISKCQPDKLNRGKHFAYSKTFEKHKLFVRGIPVTMTQEEVEAVFKPYGDLQDVRIVTFRNGKSKGLAYIEYKSSSDAAKAVLATNNMEIKGFTISVAISEPPKRKTEVSEAPEPPRHSKSRLQIPLVPRSVQVVASKPVAPTLTNEDFRKMLLNEK